MSILALLIAVAIMLPALMAGRVLDVDNQGSIRKISRNFKQRKVAVMTLLIVAFAVLILIILLNPLTHTLWQMGGGGMFIVNLFINGSIGIVVIVAISYFAQTPKRAVKLNDWIQHKFDKQQGHDQSETPPAPSTHPPRTPPQPDKDPPAPTNK